MKDDTPELSRRPGEATPEFLVASGSTAQKIFVTRLFGAGIICGKTPCQGERCRMKLQRRLPDFAGVLSRAVFACCQRCAFGRRPRGDAHNRWPNSRCKKGIISSFSIQIICAQAGPQVSPPPSGGPRRCSKAGVTPWIYAQVRPPRRFYVPPRSRHGQGGAKAPAAKDQAHVGRFSLQRLNSFSVQRGFQFSGLVPTDHAHPRRRTCNASTALPKNPTVVTHMLRLDLGVLERSDTFQTRAKATREPTRKRTLL